MNTSTTRWPGENVMLFGLMTDYADEISFIREVLFDLTDEVPRQVYADWLDDQGDPRGEFLRIDFAMHGLDPATSRFEQLRVRRDQIVDGLDEQWVSLLARAPIESCSRRDVGVLCPLKWHALQPFGDDQTQRYCDQCGRSVTYCFTIDEARGQARKGECVAIDLAVLREQDDLIGKESEEELFMGLIDLSDD
ncbi:MAG: TIGR02996 domain-containing protein [Rubripirellula sp.]